MAAGEIQRGAAASGERAAEGSNQPVDVLRVIVDVGRDAQAPEPEQTDDLTDREREVLTLVALGHTNSEIATQLFLSVRTVESHRAHIQQKLRLSTRAELVRYALDTGLIGN